MSLSNKNEINNSYHSDVESESENNNIHDRNNYFQNSSNQAFQQQNSNFLGPVKNGSFKF